MSIITRLNGRVNIQQLQVSTSVHKHFRRSAAQCKRCPLKDAAVTVSSIGSVITCRPVAKREELIERTPEELMQEAASDELFLADLNETMEDFGQADQEDNEILTMDRLAG